MTANGLGTKRESTLVRRGREQRVRPQPASYSGWSLRPSSHRHLIATPTQLLTTMHRAKGRPAAQDSKRHRGHLPRAAQHQVSTRLWGVRLARALGLAAGAAQLTQCPGTSPARLGASQHHLPQVRVPVSGDVELGQGDCPAIRTHTSHGCALVLSSWSLLLSQKHVRVCVCVCK